MWRMPDPCSGCCGRGGPRASLSARRGRPAADLRDVLDEICAHHDEIVPYLLYLLSLLHPFGAYDVADPAPPGAPTWERRRGPEGREPPGPAVRWGHGRDDRDDRRDAGDDGAGDDPRPR